MIEMKPGHRLPNGATVLLSHTLDTLPGTYPAAIVLAHNAQNDEYATWMYVDPREENPERLDYCVEGHYHTEFERAYLDFLHRATGRRATLVDAEEHEAYREAFDAELSA